MDFLGVGFAELIFILIIAMMVFGPRRLPEIAAKAGKIVADLRGMSQGLLTEWQRELNAEAYMEELRKTKNELNDIKKELTLAGGSVARETSDVAQTIASTNLAEEAVTQVKAAGEEALSAAKGEPEPQIEAESGGGTSPDAEVEPGATAESEPESGVEAEAESGSGTSPDAETGLSAASGVEPEPEIETGAESGAPAGPDTTEARTGVSTAEEPAPEETSPAPVSAYSNSNMRPSSKRKKDNATGAQTLKTEPAVNE